MPTTDDVPHHEANRAFYDRISGVYDWLADANEGPTRRYGVEALAIQPGERVFELGFGTGNEILDLARRVAPDGTVAGIDVSPGMLGEARKKLDTDLQAVAVDLRVGDARQLPFPDGAFDAVYTSFTLELFPAEDIPVVLAEVWRVLRDDGRIGVVSMSQVPADESPSVLERGYVWMHRHFPHIVDCRPIDVTGVLTTAGFTVLSEQILEIWTMPVAVVVARKHSH